MTKIVHIISDTNIGGAGKYLLTYLDEYDREAYEVAVMIPRGSKLKPAMAERGLEIMEIDGIADRSLDFGALGQIRKLLKQKQPDIVHTHGAMIGRIAARMAGGRKVVYTRHSVFPQKWYLTKGIGKWLNGAVGGLTADGIIAVARAAAKNLTETGIDERKITVIYNGVNKLAEYDEDKRKEFRQKLGLPEGVPIIAIAARLTEVKGQDYFIRAAKIVRDKGIAAKFVIAGTGEREEHLKRLTKELGLEGTVVFTGFLQDVSGLMNVMDVQANASFGTEAASLSLMEGMGLGKPAVVSDFGGNPEIISEGENGFVVAQKDEAALAEGIIRLLTDERLYSGISVRCREIFEERFTARVMTRNMEQFYSKLLGGAK